MAADLFGDSELFSEFDKERETQNSFILDESKRCEGRIVFTLGGDTSSDDSATDEEFTTSISDNAKESKSRSSTTNTNDVSGQTISAKDILDRCVDKEDPTFQERNSETSFKILHERNKYARYAKIIDSTRYVPDEDSPGVQVLFHNNSFSRKYRPQIEKFIESLIEEESYNSRHGDRMAELPLQSSVPTCVDLNSKLPDSLRTNSMWMAHAIIGSAQFHHLFLVDPRGWPLVDLNPSLTDGWEVPVYEQVFEEPLPVDEDDGSKPQGKKAGRPKPSCFNCGGEHMMTDCPVPKDFSRIQKNRREFMDKNSPMVKKMSLSSNKIVADRFGKFKPGVMSEELREAIGLKPGQLPLHIYRMRLMGYPPGWLKEAEVNTSGLVMFDGDGREINLHGESLEDGEVNQDEEEVVVPEVKIDTKKIIEYPGFTVPVPPNMVDESDKLNMPSIQPHQLKNTLEVIVETTNTEKKRKLEEEEEEKAKKFKMDNPEVEMELSEDEDDIDEKNLISNGGFVPPLPIETPPSRPPPPASTPPVTPLSHHSKPRLPSTPADMNAPPLPVDTPPCMPPLPDGTPPSTPRLSRGGSLIRENSSQDSTPRSGSPSLETLEEQYKALVQQLGGEETSELIVMDSCSGDDPESSATETEICAEDNVSDKLPVCKTMSRTNSAVSLEAADSPVSAKSQDSDIMRMNSMFKATESISKEYSTPIMVRPNSFTALPDATKFGAGVEDHIPFENLPDSTGTFEKMRGLIKLIRSKSSIKKKKK